MKILAFALLGLPVVASQAVYDAKSMYWEPDFHCFQKNAACELGAIKYLKRMLAAADQPDFIGLTNWQSKMFGPENISKTTVYTAIVNEGICGQDVQSLLYHNLVWKPEGPAVRFCLQNSSKVDGNPNNLDYAAILQTFSYVVKPNVKFTVLSAHFTHRIHKSLASIRAAIKANHVDLGFFVLMANTNLEPKPALQSLNDNGFNSKQSFYQFRSTNLLHGTRYRTEEADESNTVQFQ
eukprot:CAMPEP_0203795414 /NCGR_PEP_ID=MMETSP0100_2-20121128/7213_1 /ASSEMBLY_ACC=CAM_ASM_000210 /TAXON_ID=96639 /ORGANISM=" , Strain NY0313808BC1" /LENGTH=236 /DNA_ID=CAMNT_0050699913 /DNA_START=434 /DNA_END=1141 /DNA_ORIENTATION=-